MKHQIQKLASSLFFTVLVLGSSAVVIFAADSGAYQAALRSYNASRHVFNTDKASYHRTGDILDLEKVQISAQATLASRDQVVISFIDYLSAVVAEKLPDDSSQRTATLSQLADFKSQFQLHLEQTAAVTDTISWYASDSAYGTLKQRFDNFAYSVFASIYQYNLAAKVDAFQALYDAQSADIIAHAKSEVSRTTNEQELARLGRELKTMQTTKQVIVDGALATNTKTSYDTWKTQADMLLNQLIKSIYDFDALWQN